MSTGFTQEVGDTVSALVVGTPDNIEYEFGIKDPKQIMRYAEGSSSTKHDFEIKIKGRHYFYITNRSDTEELHVEVSIIRTPAEATE